MFGIISDNLFLQIVFLTLIPGLELRASIVYGISKGLDPLIVFLLAVFVNVLLIFPVLFLFDLSFELIKKLGIFSNFLESVRKKTSKYVNNYGLIGLTIFVAIPLPGSGVYTACLGSRLLDMDKTKSILSMTLGVILAGFFVTITSLGLFSFF